MRHRAARRGDLPVNAEINVTSLIDVAFTLLVIFIITAPALTGGLEVNLPETRSQPLTVTDDSFIVSLDATGTIFIGETPISEEEFPTVLPTLMDAAGASSAFLKADLENQLGFSLWILSYLLAEAQQRGGTAAFVTESEIRRR